MRPGDNKWTAGIFARDPIPGRPSGSTSGARTICYDHDGINENVLVDLPMAGRSARSWSTPTAMDTST